MKYFNGTFTFNYTWDEVATAFWRRYPNSYSKHVLSEDIIFIKMLQKGVIYSKRFLTKTNHMPKWGEKISPIRQICVVEDSILDRINKTLTTYTRNIGSMTTRIMCIEEKVVYKVDPQSKDHCLVSKEAWISSSLRGFSTMLQRFGFERYKHNAHQANKGFLLIMSRLFPRPQAESKRELMAKHIRERFAQHFQSKLTSL